MNKGLISARGDWVWFVNAGDTVHPDIAASALEELLRASSGKADWILFDAEVVDDEGNVERIKRATSYRRELLRAGLYVPCHQAAIVHRQVLAVLGGFDATYRIAGDYDLFLGLDAFGSPVVVSQMIARYLTGGVSSTLTSRNRIEQVRARTRRLRRPWRASAVDLIRATAKNLRDRVLEP